MRRLIGLIWAGFFLLVLFQGLCEGDICKRIFGVEGLVKLI